MGASQCSAPNSQNYCCTDNLDACNCTNGDNALRFYGSMTVLQTIGVAATSFTSTSSVVQTSPTSPTTSTPFKSSASTSSSSPTSTPPVSTNPDSITTSQQSSTPNVAVPVGVAVPIGALGLAALSFFFYYRHRKNQNHHPPPALMESTTMRPGVYLPSNAYTDAQQVPLDTTKSWDQPHGGLSLGELSGSPKYTEPHELQT